MTGLLDASPLLILVTLMVIAWLTGSRAVKLFAMLFFFGYPLLQGRTAMPGLDINQIIDFVLNTVSYWLNEALNALVEYLKQKLSLF